MKVDILEEKKEDITAMNVAQDLALEDGGILTYRPTREATYLKMVQLLALRSTCRRAQVGCIISDKIGLIRAIGYNGNPPGMPHCIDEECLIEDGHCISTLHAEMNAISRLEIPNPVTNIPYILRCFCTHAPCLACLKVGVTKGVMTWTYLTHYEDKSRDKFIKWYNNGRRIEEVIISLQHVKVHNNGITIMA